MARVQEVAHSKVIPLLVELCTGPAGPLAAIDLNSPLPPADAKKKKGKGAKAKKKVHRLDILLDKLCYVHRLLSITEFCRETALTVNDAS